MKRLMVFATLLASLFLAAPNLMPAAQAFGRTAYGHVCLDTHQPSIPGIWVRNCAQNTNGGGSAWWGSGITIVTSGGGFGSSGYSNVETTSVNLYVKGSNGVWYIQKTCEDCPETDYPSGNGGYWENTGGTYPCTTWVKTNLIFVVTWPDQTTNSGSVTSLVVGC